MTLSNSDLGRIAFEAEQDRDSWDSLDTVRQLDWVRIGQVVADAVRRDMAETPPLYDESEVNEIRDIWRRRQIEARNDMIAAQVEAQDLKVKVYRLEDENRRLEEALYLATKREQDFWHMLPYIMTRKS